MNISKKSKQIMIKKFKEFINEEVSGTELPTGPGGSFGPGFGETRLQNKTITSHQTNLIEGIDGNIYTEDDFNDLYNQYLKSGGEPLQGFNKENIDLMLNFLENN